MIVEKLDGKNWYLKTETSEDVEFKEYIESVFEQIQILNGKKNAEIY